MSNKIKLKSILSNSQVEIIKKSENFKDLAKNHPEIVFLIKKHKIKEFYPDRYRDKLGEDFWTKELVFQYGSMCRNREEFKKLFKTAYKISICSNWIDDLMKNKLFKHENIRKHTIETILKKCKKKKINTYFQFRKSLPSEYQQSFQQGWTEQIKEYFKNKNKKNYEELKQIAYKIYKKEMTFGNKKLFLYLKLIPEDSPVIDHEIKKLKNNAIQKKPKKITLKTKKMVRVQKKYTDFDIFESAKKFKTRIEFSKKNRGAYEAAIRRGILNSVCSHMKKPPESLGEQLVRKAFNHHFNKVFYKIKPDWLRNPKTGLRLELDGYNEELKIAFEVNGGHHYSTIHQDVNIIKEKDLYKEKICKNRRIKLYVFKYIKDLSELTKPLHKIFNITMDWLDNVALDLCGKLSREEISFYRGLLKIKTRQSVVKKNDRQFAKYLNILRKQNLSNEKITQVLRVSISHLRHRIYKINKMKIYLIYR